MFITDRDGGPHVGTRKKPKKVDVMKSQVPDPAAWDTPEFEPVTRWRVDRMKDLTYTQLWFLIKERKVDHVRSPFACLRHRLMPEDDFSFLHSW